MPLSLELEGYDMVNRHEEEFETRGDDLVY